MLVLMRRKGETIRIGNDITFKVLGISEGQVSVGVKAPRNVIVDREEIRQRRVSGKWSKDKPRKPGRRGC